MYHRRSLLRNAIVSWSSDGRVAGVEVPGNVDACAGVEFYNGILVPDFVNAHCHLELSYLKGAIPQGGGFTAFAHGMGEVRGLKGPEERQLAAAEADRRMWRQGIGGVGDVCNGDSSFAVKADSPVDYLSFLELFGLGASSARGLEPLVRRAEACGLPCTVTPHATYSLQDAAFRSAVASGTGPLSVHFMESPAERELFEGRGELAAWYAQRGTAIDFAEYGSPAMRITASVPPGRDILLVHNCCVTQEDVERIEAHFTGRVTWVLCPCSNRYISRLSPPVGLLRGKGVRIAVGTDSLASNTALDMVAELRALGDVPLEELLAWATGNGAQALGMEERLGGFEAGSRSGAVLLSGLDWGNMRLTEDSRAERLL